MKQILLKIEGTVQGVNFRWHTKKEAEKLRISGWVQNAPDGSVEICAQGEEPALTDFIDWCAHGPNSANVEKITKTDQPPSPNLNDFQIR